MKHDLIPRLLRLRGWRLWVPFALGTVLAAEVIVSIMSLLLKGAITSDYLLTGLVTAGIVAPVSLIFLSRLLAELAQYQLDKAVGEARNLLQAIIDTVPMRIFWKDRELRYLGCNPAFARDAGKARPDDLLGKDDYQMGWVAQADLYRTADRAVMESGNSQLAFEEPQTTPTGQMIWLRTSKVPLHNTSGEIIGVLGIYDDITEKHQQEQSLRESEERLRLALGAANQGWFDVDLRTGAITVSAEYAQMIGYNPDEFHSSLPNWIEHVHPDDRAALAAVFQACIKDGGPRAMEYRRQTKNGDWKWLRSIGKIVEWDANRCATRMIGIHTDISERKAAEAELKKYQGHLETLVAERTAALSIAKEAAETASRAKSTFLANMSHELRTPMNAIMGMTGLALRRTEDPKLKDQLTKIEQASQHLLAVINDILDISKIEAERLTLEQIVFRLGEMLENHRSLISHKAGEKGLQLLIDASPAMLGMLLRGDPLRLGQILLNLVGNAIKFTERGSITVRARLAEDNPTNVLLRFDVLDTGIGIAAEDQPRLFTAFEQADGSMTRKYGGTGLGLAISRRLVELMGGKIGMESQPGAGSNFWFTARLDKAANHLGAAVPRAPIAPDSTAEARLRTQFAGARILLAEDEPINQEVSRGLLEDVGLTVDLAADGTAAVAMARSGTYALILMDMQMPKLNGVDATRAIRTLPGYARTPILAMTANAFEEDRQVCLAAGMNDHIGKPVDPEVLFEALVKWLSAHPQ